MTLPFAIKIPMQFFSKLYIFLMGIYCAAVSPKSVHFTIGLYKGPVFPPTRVVVNSLKTRLVFTRVFSVLRILKTIAFSEITPKIIEWIPINVVYKYFLGFYIKNKSSVPTAFGPVPTNGVPVFGYPPPNGRGFFVVFLGYFKYFFSVEHLYKHAIFLNTVFIGGQRV